MREDQAQWPLIGKWRITSSTMWDLRALATCGPAYFTFGHDNAEARLIAMELSLSCGFSNSMVHFDFSGSDEGMEVWGDGFAQLEDDGSITGELSFRDGDESQFTARRWDEGETP